MLDPMPRQDVKLPPAPREAELMAEIERLRGVLRTLARDAEFAQRHAYAGELHATMKFASDTRAKIKEAIESGEQSDG